MTSPDAATDCADGDRYGDAACFVCSRRRRRCVTTGIDEDFDGATDCVDADGAGRPGL